MRSNKRKTNSEFIKDAIAVHGDKYDYSKVEYVNNNSRVCVICPTHGEFWVRPGNHLTSKQGCPKCKHEKTSLRQTKSNEQFIKDAIAVHGDKYDYSKVEYKGANIKVCIICPEHGEFWQTPSAHTNGKQGCPKCGRLQTGLLNRLNNELFIEKSNIIHNNKYDYSKTNYTLYDTAVQITCPIHGNFTQTPDSHLQGKGCPKCGFQISNAELEIKDFLLKFIDDEYILTRHRKLIYPYELDFFIPSKQIAIEFNGIKWHSNEYKTDKQYHLMKSNLCAKKNIKLIHIFEDEFKDSKNIVLNKLKHILNLETSLPKIYGRKCIIKTIDKNTAKVFLNNFHIQAYVAATIHYGAFFNDRLVGVMSFKRLNNKSNDWELVRFASDYNYICCGVGGRLFKRFIKENNPELIKSFADRRWTVDEENNLYCQLGFKFDGYTPPDYRYVINSGIKRYHKFNFRKKILLKKFPDIITINMSEKEMCEKIKAYRIYDCGLIRYVWKKEF